jgi:hypothetical protein
MVTRLLEFEEVKLVINQSIVLVEWSLHLKIGVIYLLFVPNVIFFELSTLFIKHCLLILPLFVAICVIRLSGLTYGMYLVSFLKPGAIKWYQSNADCRTQA